MSRRSRVRGGGIAVFRALLLALPALAGAVVPAWAEEVEVEVANRSEPVACAEKDNVTLAFASDAVRGLRIEAAHPAYIGALVADRFAPDWTGCEFAPGASGGGEVRRVTIYETLDLQLVGLIYPSFWRSKNVPVRVGGRVVEGLHLLQLWVGREGRPEEVLVLYPPDGYWRARPLSPAHLRWTAYGSSFLLGPVEWQERPFVDIDQVAFDPARKTFVLAFSRGGSAEVTLSRLDQDRIALDVAFDRVIDAKPFAALRSMFVTETNADVARVAWRPKHGGPWREAPVMTFPGGKAVTLWAGRSAPSRHNTSAPDMTFGPFRAEPQARP